MLRTKRQISVSISKYAKSYDASLRGAYRGVVCSGDWCSVRSMRILSGEFATGHFESYFPVEAFLPDGEVRVDAFDSPLQALGFAGESRVS